MAFAPDQPALHEQSEMLSLCTGEYEFGRHVRHEVFCSVEYDPAEQFVQLSVAELTSTENFPPVQSEHTLFPGFALYFPAAQPVHSVLSPVHPGAQRQEDKDTLPSGEVDRNGHGEHGPPSIVIVIICMIDVHVPKQNTRP